MNRNVIKTVLIPLLRVEWNGYCIFWFVMQACDRLLLQRVDMKMKGRKVNDVLNRLHIAMPSPRDDKVRRA